MINKEVKDDLIINPTFKLEVNKEKIASVDYARYRAKWNDNPRNFVVDDVPIHIDLELNTTCNLKCPFCPHSEGLVPSVVMDLEDAVDIISRAAKLGVSSMKFNYRGEPLLYKNLPELIKHAKDEGILETMINTNATFLDEKMQRALINSGLDLISCSVDGVTCSVYEAQRVGADFYKVTLNIVGLSTLKKIKRVSHPRIRLQMVKTELNESHVESFVDFWKAFAEEVAVVEVKDITGKINENTPLPDWFCSQLWQRLFVLADGDVVPCCRGVLNGYEKPFVIGNIFKDSIKKLWNNKKLNAMRKAHREGRSHDIAMCRRCGVRQEVIKQNG